MSGNGGQHPGDPGRRLRRHRYQEGPGFLFLATQGGRPPGSSAGESLGEVRRRMRAVRLAAEGGLEAALAAGYSRRSVFRWNRLYRAGGIIALLPQSRSRREAQAAVPDWVGRVVIAIRLATYWNSKRISAEMERRQIYRVGHTYIDELSSAMAAVVAALLQLRGRATNGASPTNSGTSTSRARSSSTSAVGTSRLGSWVWLTTTLAS